MSQRPSKAGVSVAVLAAVLVAAEIGEGSPPVSSARTEITWRGAGPGARWGDPANWDGGRVPGPLDIARFDGEEGVRPELMYYFRVAPSALLIAPILLRSRESSRSRSSRRPTSRTRVEPSR